MQGQLRVTLAGIRQDPGVGGDQRVHAMIGGTVHGALPALPALGLRVGVDRDIEFALVLTNVGDRCIELLVVHVQSGEMPGIGVIAKTDINGVGALAHRRFERRQVACRADQLHGESSSRSACGPARRAGCGQARGVECAASLARPAATALTAINCHQCISSAKDRNCTLSCLRTCCSHSTTASPSAQQAADNMAELCWGCSSTRNCPSTSGTSLARKYCRRRLACSQSKPAGSATGRGIT
ncbi:hypothetical protein D3C78_1300000 [compost metagenome]